MRRLLVAVAALAVAWGGVAAAQVHVRGYTRKDGTYVQPHERSSPNGTTADNYSTRGNINPYTGEAGTKNPDPPRSYYYSPPPASPRPTATCRDGSTSYSQSASGTCSGHGGVAQWY
jgi:hypothetical protein